METPIVVLATGMLLLYVLAATVALAIVVLASATGLVGGASCLLQHLRGRYGPALSMRALAEDLAERAVQP